MTTWKHIQIWKCVFYFWNKKNKKDAQKESVTDMVSLITHKIIKKIWNMSKVIHKYNANKKQISKKIYEFVFEVAIRMLIKLTNYVLEYYINGSLLLYKRVHSFFLCKSKQNNEKRSHWRYWQQKKLRSATKLNLMIINKLIYKKCILLYILSSNWT